MVRRCRAPRRQGDRMDPHTGFTIMDYAVIGIILLSGLLAIFSGFVREIYSLFNWVASFFIGFHFYRVAEPYVKNYVSNPNTVMYLSIFIVFCVSFILLALVGIAIKGLLIRGAGITAIDRSLGFVYGLARGFVVVSALYLAATIFLWPDIDKVPTATATLHDEPGNNGDHPKDEMKEGMTMAPPNWVVDARTRPMLAMGAVMMREFIPDKMLEKTTAEYLDRKTQFEDKLNTLVIDKKDQDLIKEQETQ